MAKILVCDDDKNTRRLFKAVLEGAGYDVLTAEDGEAALEIMSHEKIDLLLVDVMMPGIDGYQLTGEIRLTDPELPILMVSAKLLPQDRRQGFLAGIDDYITKPVDEEEMLLRIKALLRRAKIYSEKKLVIGPVTLLYDDDTVTRSDTGETILLPQKEFRLLFKLLSNPGKIFTRIELLEDIWGYDSETSGDSVTVHAGRLRRRFESWPEFTIVSVRGLGYKGVRNVE